MTKLPVCPHCGSPLPTPQGIVADIFSGRVTFRGHSTRLTPIEFDVFQALLLSYGRTVPLDRLISMVYGNSSTSNAVESIKVYISKVRWKIAHLGLEIPKGKWGNGGYTLIIPPAPDAANLVAAE